jgi:hypothetical protein
MVAIAKNKVAFPTQDSIEVCHITKQIRQNWTPEQREYRAELARQKQALLIHHFIKAAGLADAS